MSHDHVGTMERLWRRIQMAVGRGRVTTGNDSGNVQMLQVQLNKLEVGDNRPRVAEFGFTSMPPAGTDVIVVFIGGDRSNGAIIATNHQSSRPKNLKDGEVMIYDTRGQSVYLSESGIVINGGGLPMTIMNTPEITADTPTLACTGDIIDNCNTNPHTMAQMRSIYNNHNHQVTGVQSGSSTVTTNSPSATE